jgi:hypothetical protein
MFNFRDLARDRPLVPRRPVDNDRANLVKISGGTGCNTVDEASAGPNTSSVPLSLACPPAPDPGPQLSIQDLLNWGATMMQLECNRDASGVQPGLQLQLQLPIAFIPLPGAPPQGRVPLGRRSRQRQRRVRHLEVGSTPG